MFTYTEGSLSFPSVISTLRVCVVVISVRQCHVKYGSCILRDIHYVENLRGFHIADVQILCYVEVVTVIWQTWIAAAY